MVGNILLSAQSASSILPIQMAVTTNYLVDFGRVDHYALWTSKTLQGLHSIGYRVVVTYLLTYMKMVLLTKKT